MFPFSALFTSLPRIRKALVDDCGLTLKTRWRENAPKRETFKFRLPSVAHSKLSVLKLPNDAFSGIYCINILWVCEFSGRRGGGGGGRQGHYLCVGSISISSTACALHFVAYHS